MTDRSSDRDLLLFHPDLSALPPVPALPDGYRLRTWQDGDETKVPPVLGEAFFDDPEMAAYETFRRYLEEKGGFTAENIFVVETASGEVVGTTTARFLSPRVGRLHRVGVRPAHQDRGLGKILTLWALHHLAHGGAQTAYVGTQESRLAAVAVYLHAGFQPVLSCCTIYEQTQRIPPDDLEQIWEEVYARLDEFRSVM
jgi:mycothiol synthase